MRPSQLTKVLILLVNSLPYDFDVTLTDNLQHQRPLVDTDNKTQGDIQITDKYNLTHRYQHFDPPSPHKKKQKQTTLTLDRNCLKMLKSLNSRHF